jgi:hypothetical protein
MRVKLLKKTNAKRVYYIARSLDKDDHPFLEFHSNVKKFTVFKDAVSLMIIVYRDHRREAVISWNGPFIHLFILIFCFSPSVLVLLESYLRDREVTSARLLGALLFWLVAQGFLFLVAVKGPVSWFRSSLREIRLLKKFLHQLTEVQQLE